MKLTADLVDLGKRETKAEIILIPLFLLLLYIVKNKYRLVTARKYMVGYGNFCYIFFIPFTLLYRMDNDKNKGKVSMHCDATRKVSIRL